MTMPDFGIGSDVWPGIAKLGEEAGEVVQVILKLVAMGGEVDHWDGTDLRERLIEEMGDLAAAVDYVYAHNFDANDKRHFGRRKAMKGETFARWHDQVSSQEEV